MNTSRNHLTSLLGLDTTEQHPTTRIRFAVTSVTTFATTVQIIVWLLIGIFTTHLDGPWWLWTPLAGLAVNATLSMVDRVRAHWSATADEVDTAGKAL